MSKPTFEQLMGVLTNGRCRVTYIPRGWEEAPEDTWHFLITADNCQWIGAQLDEQWPTPTEAAVSFAQWGVAMENVEGGHWITLVGSQYDLHFVPPPGDDPEVDAAVQAAMDTQEWQQRYLDAGGYY